MSISSSNTFSVGSHSTNGIAGLASGMDTDAMVEQMLSGIQGKIDKQEQLKQQTSWKQEIYWDIISDINGFKSTYFDVLSSSNLMSGALFNSMMSESTSNAVKIIGSSSSAVTGDMKIEVDQLASASNMSSAGTMSSGKITGRREGNRTNNIHNIIELVKEGQTNADGQHVSKTVKITLDGKNVDLILDKDLFGTETNEETNIAKLQQSLNDQLKKAFGTTNGKQTVMATFNSDGNIEFSGFVDNTTNPPTTVDTLKGRQLSINGSTFGAEALGLKDGFSNVILTGQKLGDANFNIPLQGDMFKFSINDTEFTFSKNDTISTVISKINNSDAGVRIAYSSLENKFTMESTTKGSGQTIDIKQEAGNLLNAMFGNIKTKVQNADGTTSEQYLSNATQLGGLELGTDTVTPSGSMQFTDNIASLSAGRFKINVNGVDYNLNIENQRKDKDGNPEKWASIDEIAKEINRQIHIKITGNDDDIKLEKDSTGAWKMSVSDNSVVKFGAATVDMKNSIAVQNAASTDFTIAFGFSAEEGSNNLATNADEALQVLQNKGISVGAIDADTLNDANSNIRFDASTGRLIYDKDPAKTDHITNNLNADGFEKLFGQSQNSWDTYANMGSDVSLVDGTNAKVKINDIETERSDNLFTVNGVTIEVTRETTGSDPVMISTNRDTSKVTDIVKGFVDDYNKLIKKLNELIDQDADYKKYPPLTSAQKKEMSESEIKAWEEKAKIGLIRNDSTISTFLSNMRTILYQKPKGSKLAIYDIGIDTSDDWKKKGQLTFNESKFKQMLESDPDSIRLLFTDPDEGIATQFSKVIDAVAKTSSGSPGTLVSMAGTKGTSALSTQNTMYKRLRDIEDKLTKYKKQYETEKTRYWRQFTEMEKLIANMNSQSSWLSQQFY